MAVHGNSLMPFSIQAILNKKDSRHLPDLDMCFSKTACWKIFGEMNGGSRGDDREGCEPTDQKSYDSDSGLSDDNDSKPAAVCKSEKHGDPASDVQEESLQEETDHESAAADNTKSDSETGNAAGKYANKQQREIKSGPGKCVRALWLKRQALKLIPIVSYDAAVTAVHRHKRCCDCVSVECLREQFENPLITFTHELASFYARIIMDQPVKS